jgi:HEPN domain-containing protein/predicted nucleotidyltransferase
MKRKRLDSIEDVVDRLIEVYQPERIILFGSHATGEARKDSDFDLLIVKETRKPPIERRMEVERFLADREIPLDIFVYTPQEVRFLFSMGSPLIEEIASKGKVLYMRRATEGWLRDARDELESALILHDHGKYKGACYHSQQCVEKCLKVLILEKGQIPERVHDIVQLLNKVGQLGWDMTLDMDDAVFLNSIYKSRYPTERGLLPYGEPSKDDSERAVGIAQKVMNRLQEIL